MANLGDLKQTSNKYKNDKSRKLSISNLIGGNGCKKDFVYLCSRSFIPSFDLLIFMGFVKTEIQIVEITESMIEDPSSILDNKLPISIASYLLSSNCLRN